MNEAPLFFFDSKKYRLDPLRPHHRHQRNGLNTYIIIVHILSDPQVWRDSQFLRSIRSKRRHSDQGWRGRYLMPLLVISDFTPPNFMDPSLLSLLTGTLLTNLSPTATSDVCQPTGMKLTWRGFDIMNIFQDSQRRTKATTASLHLVGSSLVS